MMNPSGYQIIEDIYESALSLVYRGYRIQDEQPVILKVLKAEYPTKEEVAKYQLEYEITRSLNLEGVVKAYSLEKYRNRLVIVLEDFGGKSLNLLISIRKFALEEFLKLAIQTTEILGQLHHHNIIHKDINPSNIVLNPVTEQVKLIDFGISTVLSRENQTLRHPNLLEGTLVYMSPEQTGRMNRAIDYRTDFYSLGATFYELLTHQLPCNTDDAMELVHCHIAKQPISPHELNPEIPKAVSDIVMKLLAKTAEERYQSAYGIKADLHFILNQLKANKKIDNFPLATHDVSEKFQIPQKLYGRESEIETLLAAFDRVAGRLTHQTTAQQTTSGNPLVQGKSEMMLVSGYSGVGKSALVNEVHKLITRQRGYFISGKFDQFRRNIPFAALIQTFRELIRQLLTESEAQITAWREKILAALGVNGQIIIEAIPELELIIGKQPPVPELAPAESQNRSRLVFQNFISVFTKPEHPLVIFLDDLHWADSSSLRLIQLLMTEFCHQSLLIIGAYRDNEVDAAHPLMLTLDEIKKTKAIVHHIFLKPLELTQVNHLISDALNCLDRGKALAELVLNKTQGNPFFIKEFLKYLYENRLIDFDLCQRMWQWDIEEIQAAPIADNVVDLMVKKIKTLPEKTQHILKLAACIGNQFDLQTLSIVNASSQVITAANLWEAIREGLIVPIGNAYKFVQVTEKFAEPLLFEETGFLPQYKFLHDRVQQAAYSLIPADCKQVVHLRVGQLLLKNTPPDEREEKIFDIVNQLNFGAELITNLEEQINLAELNFMAGKKAKLSAAYEPALNYFKLGIGLLGVDSWQQHYDLTLKLYVESTEVAYLSTHFDEMESLAEVVLQKAKKLLDKVKIYEVRIQAYIAQNKLLEAVKIALGFLKLLGISFPEKPTPLNSLLGLGKTKLILAGKQIEDLVNLPEMTDAIALAAMRILLSVGAAAYLAVPELMPLLVFKLVSLSCKYGNALESVFAYASYGLILSGVVGDIDSGYQFGQLALSLLERFNAKKITAKTSLLVNDLITHWKEHLRETLKPLLNAYQTGLETGDLEFAALSVNAYLYHSYFVGEELSKLEKEIAVYSIAVSKLKQETTLHMLAIWRQTSLNLLGRSEERYRLMGEAYNEEIMLPLHLEANDKTAVFLVYFNKLVLCYLFGDYHQAIENADLTEKYLDGGLGTVTIALFHLYDSLARIAVLPDVQNWEQKRILRRVVANQKKLKKRAHYAPMNHLHKFYMVEAERYRILGQNTKAMDYYDRAIEAARKNEYLNEEALAHELAAKFYLTIGKIKIAEVYMQDARYCYLRWGATAKVDDLDQKYSQLFSSNSDATRKYPLKSKTSTPLSSSGSNDSEALDLATVMKASQALSGEIVLDKLLARLMKILIENAGAQKGLLILETKGQLLIEAEKAADTDGVTVLQSIPVENSQQLSSAIINYVARTKENVVLNDAANEGQFTKDSYILENKPKSVICAPLLNQGKLVGIIYLENNLTTEAFTPDRLEVLNLLSAQAAISIENARLYKNMAELNVAYSRFVPREFLHFLEKESIIDVRLGDQVQKEMSVLFADIRSFTTLSESMTPEDNFKFINAYLSRMEPAILENQGFIDKYIGDAIMALFPGEADDAVKAAIAMLKRLEDYNTTRHTPGRSPLKIGIGINTGSLMLGTVGGQNRMDGTVISDAVNVASRLESLTKDYGVSLLISHGTFSQLQNPTQYAMRLIDRVKVRGKSQTLSIFEVFEADPPEMREAKLATKTLFEQALTLYHLQKLSAAEQIFQHCLRQNPMDKVAKIYLERCQQFYILR